MNFYNNRFFYPNDRERFPERERNRFTTLPYLQTMDHSYVRSPQCFPNYFRNINPRFSNPNEGNLSSAYMRFPDHKSFIRGPCSSHDWNFQYKIAPDHSRYYHRNEVHRAFLPPYNSYQRYNCEYSQLNSEEFYLQNILKQSSLQGSNPSTGNVPQFSNFSGMKLDTCFNPPPHYLPNNGSIRIHSTSPYYHCTYNNELQNGSYLASQSSNLFGRDENANIIYQTQYTPSGDANLLSTPADFQTICEPTVSQAAENIESYSNSEVQNTENGNVSEEFLNAINSTDENSLAVYFLKNLHSNFPVQNVVSELTSANQNTALDNCDLNSIEQNEASCLDIAENATESISSNLISEIIDELTEPSNNKNDQRHLNINTGIVDESQNEENSSRRKSSGKNLSNYSNEYKNQGVADDQKKVRASINVSASPSVCNKCKDKSVKATSGLFPNNNLNDKLNSEIDKERYIFPAPIINIIHLNQVSTDKSTVCLGDFKKVLEGNMKSDHFSNTNSRSYLTNNIMKFLLPYVASFSEEEVSKQNTTSLCNENLTLAAARIDSNIPVDVTNSVSETAEIPTTVKFTEESEKNPNPPACVSQEKPSNETEINFQILAEDAISSIELPSTENYNSSHERNPTCFKENNGSIQLNLVDPTSTEVKQNNSDFIYSGILDSEILSSHTETSLSSVTNYILCEPDGGSLEKSFENNELEYISASPSNKLQKELRRSKRKQEKRKKQRKYVQMAFNNSFFSPNVCSASNMLLDNIFESDTDDQYSLDMECNFKCSAKKKMKLKRRSLKKNDITLYEGDLYLESKNFNAKKINNSESNTGMNKLFHDATTQTSKLEKDILTNRSRCKRDVETQWNSSEGTVHTIELSRMCKDKAFKSHCSMSSCKNFHYQTSLDNQNNQENGLVSSNKSRSLRRRNSVTNKGNAVNKLTTDETKISNTIAGKRTMTNSPTDAKKISSTTANIKITNDSTTTARKISNTTAHTKNMTKNSTRDKSEKIIKPTEDARKEDSSATNKRRTTDNYQRSIDVTMQSDSDYLRNKKDIEVKKITATKATPERNLKRIQKSPFISNKSYYLRKSTKNT